MTEGRTSQEGLINETNTRIQISTIGNDKIFW